METVFNKLLVTSEKADTFPAACGFIEFMVTRNKPLEVDFMFINDDLSHLNTQVKERVQECINLMHSQNIMTEHSFRQGNFHRGIIDMAQYSGTDLIICGAELVKGFRRFWNGSETYKLIKEAPCYVVSIQKPMKRQSIKKIVLPIDTTQETRQKVPAAMQMAKLFDATIHVLGVSSSNSPDTLKTVKNYAEQAADFMRERDTKVEIDFLQGTNLTDVTLQYVDNIDADMLMIMAVEEPNPYGMFEGSFPEQMILKSQVPVISIKLREDLKVTYFAI
ncbi:MAG: universal stress protein [Bacteroidota bacterium]|nr:universal stress protein [Bacteroidota bacterium]